MFTKRRVHNQPSVKSFWNSILKVGRNLSVRRNVFCRRRIDSNDLFFCLLYSFSSKIRLLLCYYIDDVYRIFLDFSIDFFDYFFVLFYRILRFSYVVFFLYLSPPSPRTSVLSNYDEMMTTLSPFSTSYSDRSDRFKIVFNIEIERER